METSNANVYGHFQAICLTAWKPRGMVSEVSISNFEFVSIDKRTIQVFNFPVQMNLLYSWNADTQIQTTTLSLVESN